MLGPLTLNFGGPVHWGIFTQLADTDWQHDNGVGAFRVVIQTHFGAVNDDTFMNGIRQDQLLRNIQYGTRFWQIRVNARVCFQHVRQAQLVLCGEILQRLRVTFWYRHHLVFAHQTASVCRQGIRHRRRGLTKPTTANAAAKALLISCSCCARYLSHSGDELISLNL